MFETASFHIVKPCNMQCKFCYATFQDMNVVKQMPATQAMEILHQLKEGGVQKITFAGGEPLLYEHLSQVVRYANYIGLTTSIITNGYFLSHHLLQEYMDVLDWIGLSVDSINPDTNELIGRKRNPLYDYLALVDMINHYNYKLKITTVVNAYNKHESLQKFIDYAEPQRWKIFQALRVEGQNDSQFHKVSVTAPEFYAYVSRHHHPNMVVEDNEAMTGSYLLIDPQGRLFENSKGTHTYSQPLYQSTLEKCLAEINLDREQFIKRSGIYDW